MSVWKTINVLKILLLILRIWIFMNLFSLLNNLTQILLFPVMLVSERSNVTVWERHLFKSNFCYGSFRYISTLRKMLFSGASVKCFLSMAQITQILLFLGMLVLERSKAIVWERQLFKKISCYGSFRYVSTLREKVFSMGMSSPDHLYLKR